MKNEIQLFGFQARLNIIEMKCGFGILKELVINCTKEVGEKIIKEAIRRNMPFERINEGVKIFQ